MKSLKRILSRFSSRRTSDDIDIDMNSNTNTTNTTNTSHPNLRGARNIFSSGPGNGHAYALVGTPVRITGKKGRIYVAGGKVKTGYRGRSEFIMEYVQTEKKKSKRSGNQRLVAFRLKDTSLYLSQNPYGNEAKAQTLKSISSLPILPEISREIVDFAVGGGKSDREGQGFDYRPIHLEQGPPGLLQQFTLEGTGLRKVGIKSVYGKYWRAPTWSDTVLQSPHQLSDEDFCFEPIQNQPF